MSKTLYINGRWESSDAVFEHRNPANLGETTGVWAAGSVGDAERAIDAAESAFEAWRKTPPVKRADLFRGVLSKMQERIDDIARTITIENGKTLAESRSEVQSGYREMEFQIGEGVRMNGTTIPSINPGILTYSVRKPLGVVSIITPWNFPFNVPVRKITPALMAGNTCVFKPASLTPGVGKIFTELFEEFPPGVINFVPGSGSTVGRILSTDPRIRALSFTGSTEVGRGIHRVAAEQVIRTQLEMGGKNPVVVLADADLEAAAEGIVLAGYTCAGQWCTSTSRVIVEQSAADELTDLVTVRVNAISTGNGLDKGHTMGPVCGAEQFENINAYIEIGKREGAVLAAGGTSMGASEDGPDYRDGCFIAPTVFSAVEPSMRIAKEEIFGPVVSIIPARDLANAIDIANSVDFGLTSSIFTRDIEHAFTFVEESEVGFTHVNLMSGYREPAHSFGGIKASGHDLPESGRTGIEFFTESKAVYVKYRA